MKTPILMVFDGGDYFDIQHPLNLSRADGLSLAATVVRRLSDFCGFTVDQAATLAKKRLKQDGGDVHIKPPIVIQGGEG